MTTPRISPITDRLGKPATKYSHMCRDGHVQIGHNDSSMEWCPLCRANAEAKALREALQKLAIRQLHRLAYGGTTVHTGWTCMVCRADWGVEEKPKHWPSCVLGDSQ